MATKTSAHTGTTRQTRSRTRSSKWTGDAASRLRRLAVGGAGVPEVLRALREAGIKDLEDLVGHVIGKVQAEAEALDVFAPIAESPAGTSFSHRPPKMPFTVGGVTYDPVDIKRFDGKPLHLVCRPVANNKVELIGFVGNEWIRAFTAYAQMRQLGWLGALSVGSPMAGPPQAYYIPSHPYWDPYPGRQKEAVAMGISPGHEIPSLIARFYEDANFEGDHIRLDGNRQVSDLTKFGRGFLSLGDWNDVISSMQSGGATVLLFEHINYAGDTLLALPTDILNNLEDVGFNDRTSSIKNFGLIY